MSFKGGLPPRREEEDPDDVPFWRTDAWPALCAAAGMPDASPGRDAWQVWGEAVRRLAVPGEPRSEQVGHGLRVVAGSPPRCSVVWVHSDRGGSAVDALLVLAAATCADPPEEVVSHAAVALLGGRVTYVGWRLR